MLRHAVVVLALIACKQTEAPPPVSVESHRLPVLTDEVATQVGNFGMGFAIDVAKLDREMIAGFLPATPACIGASVRAAKQVVVTQTGDSWHVYVTGVAKTDLEECIGLFDSSLALSTKGDMAVLASGSDTSQAGPISSTIVELLHAVPKTAIGWIASSGLPEKGIKTLVGWLEVTAPVWTFTVRVEGPSAQKYVDDVRGGVIDGFKDKGVTTDPAWFTTSSTPTSATLIAAVPLAALARH